MKINNNYIFRNEQKELERLANEYKKTIKQCKNKLNEKKKKYFGFHLEDSVIGVEERGYGISIGDDILFTYGIDTCTGIAITDETINLLMHIDTSSVDDVIKIFHKFNFSQNAKVFIFPGAHKMPGQFDYEGLVKYLSSIDIQYQVKRIPETFGFVKIDYDGTIEMGCLNKTFYRNITKAQQNNKYNKQSKQKR